MITFGTPVKWIYIRPEPETYDLLVFDGIGARFFPYEDNHKIESEYKCGWQYHILLYKKQLYSKLIKDIEGFEACLINPIDFAESVTANGYSGCIGKISDMSAEMFDEMWHELLLKGNVNEYLIESGA